METRKKHSCRYSSWEMIGKPLYRIRLTYCFVKLVRNICKQEAFSNHDAVDYICGKLPVRFWKPAGNFIDKSQNFSFQAVSNWCRIRDKGSPSFCLVRSLLDSLILYQKEQDSLYFWHFWKVVDNRMWQIDQVRIILRKLKDYSSCGGLVIVIK